MSLGDPVARVAGPDRSAALRAMSTSAHNEVLLPSKSKWVLMLLACVAFVAGGVLIVGRPESSHDRFWGYACIVCFGAGTVVALIQFVPGSSFLRLSAEGITIRSMWRTTFYRWSDIERFGVAEFTTSQGGIWRRHRLVGLDFSASYPSRGRARTLKNINRDLTGFEAALPDTYGWDYTQLAAHLNRVREEYASSGEPARAA